MIDPAKPTEMRIGHAWHPCHVVVGKRFALVEYEYEGEPSATVMGLDEIQCELRNAPGKEVNG